MGNLEALVQEALTELESATAESALEQLRVQYLGKKGKLTDQLKSLGRLSPEERPAAGAAINEAKEKLQDAIARKRTELEQAALTAKLARETLDVTLPGRREATGSIHPVTRTIQRIESFFGRLCYTLAVSSDFEVDYVIFED